MTLMTTRYWGCCSTVGTVGSRSGAQRIHWSFVVFPSLVIMVSGEFQRPASHQGKAVKGSDPSVTSWVSPTGGQHRPACWLRVREI